MPVIDALAYMCMVPIVYFFVMGVFWMKDWFELKTLALKREMAKVRRDTDRIPVSRTANET